MTKEEKAKAKKLYDAMKKNIKRRKKELKK